MKDYSGIILLGVACLLAILFQVGCSGILLHHALDQGQALTPSQIKEYKELNQDVWGCFTIGGPPPSGLTTWIVMPKGSAGPTFGDGCHVIR